MMDSLEELVCNWYHVEEQEKKRVIFPDLILPVMANPDHENDRMTDILEGTSWKLAQGRRMGELKNKNRNKNKKKKKNKNKN